MSNQETHVQSRIYKIYLKDLHQWVPVSKTDYDDYYRDINSYRRRQQEHGRCVCPASKRYLCDMDCWTCHFHKAGDECSLDYTIRDEDGNNISKQDHLEDASANVEEIATDQIVLKQLVSRLYVIMPEAGRIGEFRLAGLTDTEIAGRLGIARTTFLSQIKRAADMLRREYPDFF